MPGVSLRTLSHHIDLDWMREAHRRVRKDGAVGVDGQTADEYAQNLQSNLRTLLDRAKSGDHYRAPPVRRVHIPKGDGSKTRPIGIPTFEDKILQKAVAIVLEAVYEQDFLPCSYGFRPGRGAHDALSALWKQMMDLGGGWVLEADIESFFDSVDHAKLREVLSQRVGDGVLTRLIGKWLKAGVMEDGVVRHPETGTPQGGVISPLLANVYLHEVLDMWWEREVRPRMSGRTALVRYADDFVLVFETEEDARRVEAVLSKRFEKYGLKLHPEKTRLTKFARPDSRRQGDADGRSPSFDLLGFTHFWAKSRKGAWVIKRKTMRARLSRTLKRISMWCSVNRHLPIKEQHAMLSRKLRGHDAYYGITGNARALSLLRPLVARIWQKWLNRRSWKAALTWTRMNRLLEVFPLPPPRVVHSVYRLAKP
ncbi:MAG: group II intron reverse transcriptase/maturase [Polyangiaceae bacterium]